ncbi:DUF2599 domain-containing protein [Cellulomonas sp. Marseille-Q8402]
MTSSRVRFAAVLTALALLAACSASPAPGPTTRSPTPAPSTTAFVTTGGTDGMRADGLVVRAGEAALSVWPPLEEVAGVPDEDGAVPLTAGVPEGEGWDSSVVTVLWLVAPEGMALERLDDGSAVLRDASGRAAGAVTAPVLGGAAVGSGLRVQAIGSDGALEWRVTLPVRTDGTVEEPPGGTVTATFAGSAVREATWRDLEDEGGRSLAVVPATWARGGSLAAEELVRAQLGADADSATMRDQLSCHLIGAPDKASWNLEPWRPDVGLLGMIGALCNPE